MRRSSLNLVVVALVVAAVLFGHVTSVRAQTVTAVDGGAFGVECTDYHSGPAIAVEDSDRNRLSIYLTKEEVDYAVSRGLTYGLLRCLGARQERSRIALAAWMNVKDILNVPHIDAEYWRPLVSVYFPPERVDWAVRIIQCESGGDPLAKNPRSSASGLFQHLASAWEKRSLKAGWAGASVWDPEANIAVAAWLLETGGPGHWACGG